MIGLFGPTARTIYVDSAAGNNAAAGTEAAPIQTLGQLSSRSLVAGDRIALKRGGVWREELFFPASGARGKPIQVFPYGAGSTAPRVSGGGVLNGWARVGATAVWSLAHAATPSALYSNRIKLTRNTGTPTTPSNNQWGFSAGTVYVNVGGVAPATGQIDEKLRSTCITLDNHSWVEWQGIEFGEADFGLNMNPGAAVQAGHVAIGCTFRNCQEYGIQIAHTTVNTSESVLAYNEIYDCPGDGISIGRRVSDTVIVGNHVHNCCTESTAFSGGFTAAIHLWGAVDPASPGASPTGVVTNILIANNHVHDIGVTGFDSNLGSGIWVDEVSGGCKVHRNLVYNCASAGLIAENTSAGGEIIGNLVYNCGKIASDGSFGIFCSRGCQGWLVAHNTVADCQTGFALAHYGTTGFALQNNTIKNNTFSGSIGNEVRAVLGGESATNTWQGNNVGANRTSFIQWMVGGTTNTYSTYAALAAAVSAPAWVQGAPSFTNAGTRDYTLAGGSPLISAGVTTAGVAENRLGAPYGSPPNVGAH